MPYIPAAARQFFAAIETMTVPIVPGELNYVISRLVRRYVEQNGRCYRTMNEVVGVLDLAKHEFQRRVIDPYEDEKRAINGDIE